MAFDTVEPFKVMLHNPFEYGVRLTYPTDNVFVHDFYHYQIINIDDFLHKYRKLIPNERTLLVLFGLYQNLREVDAYPWLQKLDEFYQGVPNPMVVFNGRLTSDAPELVSTLTIPYYRLLMFDRVSVLATNATGQHMGVHEQTYCTERSKKFQWFSSKDYYPRRYLLSQLIGNDLLTQGHVNYKCIHSEFSNMPDGTVSSNFPDHMVHGPDADRYQHIAEQCELISSRLPLPALDNTIEYNLTDPAFYRDAYLGIVTDTTYDDSGIFISEKIFNAMKFGQMFFYLGPPGTLQYLRDTGYKTFSHVIDESHDLISDPVDRLIQATRSVTEFLRQPMAVIRQAYEASRDTIMHNRELLLSQRPDLKYTEYCKQALEK